MSGDQTQLEAALSSEAASMGATVQLIEHSETAGFLTIVYEFERPKPWTVWRERRIAVYGPGADHAVWSSVVSSGRVEKEANE